MRRLNQTAGARARPRYCLIKFSDNLVGITVQWVIRIFRDELFHRSQELLRVPESRLADTLGEQCVWKPLALRIFVEKTVAGFNRRF